MKTINNFLLVGAVAFGFTLANQARAEAFLSPRAQENQTRIASTSAGDVNYVNGNFAGAALKAQALPNSVATTSGPQPNLVNGNFRGAAGKFPGTSWNDYQIAPAVDTTK